MCNDTMLLYKRKIIILSGKGEYYHTRVFVGIIIFGIGLIYIGCKKNEPIMELSDESFKTNQVTVYSDEDYDKDQKVSEVELDVNGACYKRE